MTIRRDKARYIYVLLALLLLITSVHGGRYMLSAFADVERYTSVTADLKTDAAFDINAYPSDTSDYSIRVIQIGESVSDELYVYTYQPSGASSNVYATEISIATDIHKPEWRLYPLTCVSAEQTLFKYVVDGITVSDASTRYYNISEILRPFIYGADKEAEDGNTIQAVSFAVAQLWSATTTDGDIMYDMIKTEVITVTEKYVGMLRYPNGFMLWGDKACDSHYIAFDTDKRMDKLLEADVYFCTREWKEIATNVATTVNAVGSETEHVKTLSYDDAKVSNPGGGLFAKIYTWQRIETAEDFKKTADLTDDVKDKLRGKQWVLRFYESAYNTLSFAEMISGAHMQTEVSEVTILRLKFETQGVVYDLGVVDNKQTGPKDPTFAPRWSFFDWLADKLGIPVWAAKALFFGVLAIVVLAIALPVLSLVFPVVGQVLNTVLGAVWTGIVWLVKGVLWLVLLPFKGIAALVRKIKDKKDGAA